jgi:filamentous hemagglutinin family protein
MTAKHRNLRAKMLFTTAAAALLALPSAAQAQLVSAGDLDVAFDGMGNSDNATTAPTGSGGVLQVTSSSAFETTINVLKPVVIANWTKFNVPGPGPGPMTPASVLNVTNGAGTSRASLLNRVIGSDFSDIGGTINAANVNFWLINQNGILFGSDAKINAASFFASTLDFPSCGGPGATCDQEFFNFYNPATGEPVGGSDSIRFATAGNAGISGGGAGTEIKTDGTLLFLSPELNLTATFDAGTGTAAFIAASDVTVGFNAGSPVSYTMPVGTMLTSLQVGGSVAARSAQFVLLSAASMMNALLQVDASVATTAVPTEQGILLRASSAGSSTANVVVNGSLSSTGTVDASASGDVTVDAAISGAGVSIVSGGDIDLSSAASDITASGGNIALSAGGNISSAAGATLSGEDISLTAQDWLGDIFSNATIQETRDLSVTDTAGGLTVSGFSAARHLSISTTNGGGLNVNGAAAGNNITLASGGDLALDGAIDATGDTLTLTAAGSISQAGGSLAAATLTGSSGGATSLTSRRLHGKWPHPCRHGRADGCRSRERRQRWGEPDDVRRSRGECPHHG